jgi:CelD/BcsL family acetyltransferase involved in cellulose biosynthesis
VTLEPRVRATPEELYDLEAEWRQLALTAPDVSYFASPDWVLSWWETLGQHRRGHVATFTDGNRLLAVVPLVRVPYRLHRRVPLSVTCLTVLGSGAGAADHCGFAVDQVADGDVRSWLLEMSRTSTLLLPDLDPCHARRFVPAEARMVGSSPCLRLHIPADPGLIGRSAKLRKQLRAYERGLAADGVTFRWVPPDQMDGPVLDALFRLHRVRQDHARRRSTFEETSRRPLHDRLVRRAGADRGGPAAVVAERDGEAVGVIYGFRWRDVFSYYQTGWEPSLAHLNLGTVLVAKAIAMAGQDGARVFDLLRGTDAYKSRFATECRTDESWLLPKGATGRLVQLKHAAVRPAGDPARPSGAPVVGAPA